MQLLLPSFVEIVVLMLINTREQGKFKRHYEHLFPLWVFSSENYKLQLGPYGQCCQTHGGTRGWDCPVQSQELDFDDAGGVPSNSGSSVIL